MIPKIVEHLISELQEEGCILGGYKINATNNGTSITLQYVVHHLGDPSSGTRSKSPSRLMRDTNRISAFNGSKKIVSSVPNHEQIGLHEQSTPVKPGQNTYSDDVFINTDNSQIVNNNTDTENSPNTEDSGFTSLLQTPQDRINKVNTSTQTDNKVKRHQSCATELKMKHVATKTDNMDRKHRGCNVNIKKQMDNKSTECKIDKDTKETNTDSDTTCDVAALTNFSMATCEGRYMRFIDKIGEDYM